MNENDRKTAFRTWQAYNAVTTTKRRHFTYLHAMEIRRNKLNIEPSKNKNQMLEQLLRDHDEQVSAFKAASDALRYADREVFDALWI